jgi:hypothetical protein
MESLSITEPSEGLSHKLAVLGDTPSLVTSKMKTINSLDVLMSGHPGTFGSNSVVNRREMLARPILCSVPSHSHRPTFSRLC